MIDNLLHSSPPSLFPSPCFHGNIDASMGGRIDGKMDRLMERGRRADGAEADEGGSVEGMKGIWRRWSLKEG